MVQAAESLRGYDLAACIGTLFCFTTSRRSFVQCKVRSVVVIQVGYKTPIKPVIAKCVTAGTPGTDSRFTFKSKRDAEAVW